MASRFNARVTGSYSLCKHAIKNHAFDNTCQMGPPFDMEDQITDSVASSTSERMVDASPSPVI